MQARRIFLLIACVYVVGFFLKAYINNGTVYGDGRYYYSYLRSLVVDHDFNFHNEYAYFGITEPLTKIGFPRNVYSIGPALLWSPIYSMVHTILRGDGYSFPYQLAVGFGNVLFALAGLVLVYRLLNNYIPEQIGILTIIAIAFATNLFFYGALDTVNSHSVSFFISSIVVTLVLKRRSALLIGFFVGILSLIRSQDAIFLILLLPLFTLSRGLTGCVGFLLGFLPQLFVWQLINGTFMQSPYLDQDHYFDFFHPHVVEVLFSRNNGLFYWTPIMALSIIGLLFQFSFPTIPRKIFVLLWIVQLMIIASWSFWWQGESYSGRMFISLLPILSFGLASLLLQLPNKLRNATVLLFSVLNFSSIFLFLLSK